MSDAAHVSRPRIAALVVAAGRGSRAGRDVPKQYALLGGKAVLRRTLEAIVPHPAIDAVLVVIGPGDEALYGETAAGLPKLLPPAIGGATRQRSVLHGLEALAGHAPEMVLVHDAARAFLAPTLIDRVIAACEAGRGAIPALPVAETLKQVDGSLVTATIPRDNVVTAQTPQGFPFDLLLAAHRDAAAAGRDDLTDDAAVAALAGMPVAIVPGDPANVKLTIPGDFEAAERRLMPGLETRTAQGFDVHAFGPGDRLWLCSVEIPHEQGLIGHSDADVGLHALTDALLGTIGDGDIGQHFPPSDPLWKGAGSDRFLADAVRRVTKRGGRLVNLDLTLICETPKIGPYRERMRARIAEIAGVALSRVSVKATTSERLGFTGRGEGIAALALATIELPAEA